MDPVSILLPEVWELIMNKLPTHKEKLNAYNTCALWRSFLVKNRTMWMFQGIFPSLINYLPRSDILKSRLICKSWNGVIESFLENDQSLILSPGRHHVFTGRVTPFRTFQVDFQISGNRLRLSSKQALKRFEEEFTTADGAVSCTKNPIISRSIDLTLREVDCVVLTFFEKFGAHLWFLKLDVLQRPPFEISSPIQTVKFIWNILALVPNLKKLVLCAGTYNFCEDKKQMKEVEQFLRNNVVPSLPHLSDLQINTDINLMRTSLETSYCSQLRKYVHFAVQKCIPVNLTNLTDLVWLFCYKGANNQLEKFKNLNSPCLKRLHIYMLKWNDQTERNPPTRLLFEGMEKSMSSLKHLTLYWTNFEGSFPNELNLPFVEELCLEIKNCEDHESINFYFLRTLKSLCKLTFVFWEYIYDPLCDLYENCETINSDPASENIDLHQCFDEDLNGEGPLRSNIWRLLPSLDVLTVHVVNDFFPIANTDFRVYERAMMD